MADLSIVIVGGEAGGILTGCSAAEFLRHERADDLLEAVIDFFFRNMIGHLNVKDDLDVFHGRADSFLSVCSDDFRCQTSFFWNLYTSSFQFAMLTRVGYFVLLTSEGGPSAFCRRVCCSPAVSWYTFQQMALCSFCRKSIEWDDNPYRPFCSERCQLVDLGAWFGTDYRIPDDSTQSTFIPVEELPTQDG